MKDGKENGVRATGPSGTVSRGIAGKIAVFGRAIGTNARALPESSNAQKANASDSRGFGCPFIDHGRPCLLYMLPVWSHSHIQEDPGAPATSSETRTDAGACRARRRANTSSHSCTVIGEQTGRS